MPAVRSKADSTMQINNGAVLVTEWKFAPGDETGWHKHEHDYIVVPLTGGALTLETKDGLISADLLPGRSYARQKGVEHNVINGNDFDISFVEIELL
jgi:quercetin dioxygenase-like cupin family protein